jgi:hypothetical protein
MIIAVAPMSTVASRHRHFPPQRNGHNAAMHHDKQKHHDLIETRDDREEEHTDRQQPW